MDIIQDHNRDISLLKLRPALGLASEGYHSKLEQFQNNVLRPILKVQHDLTLMLLSNNANFEKQIKTVSDKESYQKTIAHFIRSDTQFRNSLIGMIVGLFTRQESQFYFDNITDVNKRIISMQVKRYADTMFKL